MLTTTRNRLSFKDQKMRFYLYVTYTSSFSVSVQGKSRLGYRWAILSITEAIAGFADISLTSSLASRGKLVQQQPILRCCTIKLM